MTANAHRRRALDSEPGLERLYVRYHDFVRGALRRHYVEGNELEDMTQQVFLVLLRRVDEAAQKRSIGAWLYQIARRVAANYHRGRRRIQRKQRALVADDAAARDVGDPEERYAREQAWSFLRDFLESLDEEACAVFVMAEIEGLRGAEIAARLRLTLAMTYARIRSVRARFDRALARSRRGTFAGLWFALDRPLVVQALATSWRLATVLAVVLLVLVWLIATQGGGGQSGDAPIAPHHASERRGGDEHDAAPRGRAFGADETHRGADASTGFVGIVVDVDGTPIRDAIVCADRTEDQRHRLNDPPACVKSDRAGRFEIRGVLARAHTLEAMARGFVPGRFRGRPRDGVRIELHRGGVELSGVVSDVHGGPIEGAWVSTENRSDATLGATVITDEAGAFSLWVVEGAVSLGAGAEGYAAAFTLALAPSTDVRIDLGAESVLAGIVVDGETGEPAEGINVSALLDAVPERYANHGRTATSDAAGRWEIRGLLPNQYVLDAAGERGWGRALGVIDLGIGEHQDGIRIELLPGVAVHGRIFDAESSEPCADGYAVVEDRRQHITRDGTVQSDGLVTVAPLTGGMLHVVEVVCRGYVRAEFEVDLRKGPVRQQEWAVRRGGELVVRVVDERGTPLPDWSVEVSELGAEATDAEGSAVFEGVDPGPRRVIATGPGHPPIVAEDVDGSFVELRATVGVSVVGTVVDADGRPVAGALVALQRPRATGALARSDLAGSAELLSGEGPYHATTNAVGAFRHASVAAGEYGVWVVPTDAAPGVQRPGTLPPGYVARVRGKPLRTVVVKDREVDLDLEIGALRSITGVVRDDEGDVIVDARVFAVREHDRVRVDPRGRPRLTDTNGHYAFDDLPEGTYSLTAYRHGGGVVRRDGVEAGKRGVDLVFRTPGSISGTVRAADGSPVAGYRLLVVDDEQRRERLTIHAGTKDGRFVANGLEEGRYRIGVGALEGDGEAVVELDAGEHRSGIEITLSPVAIVNGRLVDDSHAPRLGWIVGLRDPATGEYGNITVTGDDGRFAFRYVAARPWDFVAIQGTPSLLDPPFDMEDPAWHVPALQVITPDVGEPLDLGDVAVH